MRNKSVYSAALYGSRPTREGVHTFPKYSVVVICAASIFPGEEAVDFSLESSRARHALRTWYWNGRDNFGGGINGDIMGHVSSRQCNIERIKADNFGIHLARR